MKYQAYPEYKDSGVEWLGKIPSHWQDIRLKYVADLEGEKIEQGARLKYVGMENIASGNGKYIAKDDTNPEGLSTSFSKGDVLFGKLRPYLAKSWLAGFSGICSSEFLVLRSKKVCPQFLNYYTLTDEFINQVDSSTYGSKMPRASWDFISLMDVPVPLDTESVIIANFLDHETAKIDTLIEKQQQLIKLLKEKRKAVISHAVTKGLNPDASMRDSGVAWLGEVPEHWEVVPLKYIIKAKKGAVKAGPFGSHLKNSDMEGKDVKVIAQKNVISRDFEIGESMISFDKYRELEVFTIEHNDVLVTTRGTIGRTAIYDSVVTAILHPCLIRIQIDEDHAYPELVALIIQESGYAMEQILINSNATTIEVIYSENLINTIICLPPSLAEQKLLLGDISSRKTYFSALIEKAESAIELIQERRTALISAAVTGKIDVRNWQAPEPFHSNIETHKEEVA